MSSALSLYELDSEQADLLPARDTLAILSFVLNPVQVNFNQSLNFAVAAGINNRAAAVQTIVQVNRI